MVLPINRASVSCMAKSLCIFVLVTLGVVHAQELVKVEVFTADKNAIKSLFNANKSKLDYSVTIYDLNSVEQWENEISEGLSSVESEARKQVDQIIADMGGEDVFNQAALNAYKPLTRSVQLGLLEYPAVVVDEKYVIYGTDDVDLAVERYRSWQNSRK